MPVDPYAPCPGGTGKKLKFCCPDLMADLEKIHLMIEGDQRQACLEHIERLEAKTPGRACLMAIKTQVLGSLGQIDQAQATVTAFQEQHPGNPIALAEQATVLSEKDESLAAIAPLQRALELCPEHVPRAIYDATFNVGVALLQQGHIIAGRAHLMLNYALSGEQDRTPLQLISQVYAQPALPLLLKQDVPLASCPDDALWKKSFGEAMDLAERGAWLAAADRFRALAAKVGDWPAIWRNVATLRCWLADDAAAIEALRKYAGQNVPHDDAVEAEALAQILELGSAEKTAERVRVVYPLPDQERAQTLLAGHPRTPRMPIDESRLAAPDQPPPRAVYWLLDRPVLRSAENLTREAVPRVLGQLYLYGKQTDRDARLELVADRGTALDGSRQALAEAFGDALGPPGEPEVLLRQSAATAALMSDWLLPESTPLDERVRLNAQQRRVSLLEDWTRAPLPALAGKSAEEAKSDPACRIRLEAAVLVLESGNQSDEDGDFVALRERLGLPRPETIDPWKTPVGELPLIRLARLDLLKLSDDDLLAAFQRANALHYVTAQQRLGLEIVRRPSLDEKLDKAQIYGVLADYSHDTRQALEYVAEARRLDVKAGRSCAAWDLTELMLRMRRAEPAEIERVFEHLRVEHIREPGVAQAMTQILVEAGVLAPDGSPRQPRGAPAEAAAGIVLPGAAPTAEPGKLWTPGGETAAAGKKAIWTPGD